MKLRVLGSGSTGNALVVRSASGALLLVDCGLSCRELERRAAAVGVTDLASAAGILFTHDHVDHFAGLATFAKRHAAVPLYANGDTADALAAKTGVQDGWCVFETAVPFDVADFRVTPFSTSHDAADPVGYLIENAGAALFVGTDTGVVTAGMRDAFARADCAVLESNHDPVLLKASDRPPSLKTRIAGRSGHLSNVDAADFVRAVRPARLKKMFLAHLSQECNAPTLAREAMVDALAEAGLSAVEVFVLDPVAPGPLAAF